MKKAAEPLRITLIQADLQWENKEANLEMFSKKIDSVKEKMELVVLPEMFSTGFSMNPSLLAETMNGISVTWMRNICIAKKIVLTGSLIIEEEGHFYNRMIWMLPNGSHGYYDKRHLFGYAGEDKKYSAGTKRFIASLKGWKVNLQVCYDLRFPVWARQSRPIEPVPQTSANDDSAEYDLIVYVANWPQRRSHAWKTLLQARAIENQCYVAGLNRVGTDGNDIYYSGDSMIVDPLGEVVQSISDKEDILTCALKPEHVEEVRKRLPFLKDADPFVIGR